MTSRVAGLVVSFALLPVLAACAHEKTPTAQAKEQIGTVCRERAAKDASEIIDTKAKDLQQIASTIRLNTQVVTRIRSVLMPNSLRASLESHFTPAIVRFDANLRARIDSLRRGDYEHAYFLGLVSAGLGDRIGAAARQLQLQGCY